MGAVLAFQHRLVTECCYKCGIQFAMPESFKDECLKDRSRSFFCPSGHGQHYMGKTEAQKLQVKLDTMRAARDRALDATSEARRERDHQERRASTYKGHLTKTKNKLERTQIRVRHGVCPCCNRTFKQLAAHMKRKHPDYVEDLEILRQEGGEG